MGTVQQIRQAHPLNGTRERVDPVVGSTEDRSRLERKGEHRAKGRLSMFCVWWDMGHSTVRDVRTCTFDVCVYDMCAMCSIFRSSVQFYFL